MPATFAVDAYPDVRFPGVIRQIRDAPQTVQNVVTYDAVIEVENPNQRLKPGMTANVTFVYAERRDVLRIPSAALRFRPPPELLAVARGSAGGTAPTGHRKKHKGDAAPAAAGKTAPRPLIEGRPRRSVWVLRDERPVEVAVTVGIADATGVEVTGGELREGDALVTDAVGKDAGKGERAEAEGKAEKRARGIF
jgi:HlyD family secretion protein